MSAIFGGKKVELRQTVKAVTRFGGRVVFLEFLRKVGFAEKVSGAMRFDWEIRPIAILYRRWRPSRRL